MSDINSGLLNDVLIVGNELSGKLNEIGVSNTFGKASEGKDDLISLIRMAIDGIDMAVDTNSYVSLTATNPYMLTGETTDIVAKLRNGVCRPLPNKNVTIGQSVFIDDGTTASNNDHWYINSYGTATVQDNGTKLLNTNESGNFVMRSIIPSSKTITEANSYSYNPPFVVEFDIVETDATTSNSDAQVQIYSSQTTGNFAQGLTTGHYKIEVKENEQKIWVDDTLIKTTNLSLTNARITLRVRNSKYLIYKNFVVYEIINGVTDAKGEFALYDISDDAIFTATYGTEIATCLVEYCDFVDYAVTNNKNNTWFNNTGGIVTVDDSGTTFTAIPHSNGTHWTCGYCPGSTTIRNPFNYPIVVEFDILRWDTGSSIWIKSDLGNRANFNRELNHVGSRVRIEIGTTSTRMYIDGVFVSEKTYTQPSSYGIELGIYISKNDVPTAPSLKFANLTIKPL